MPGKWAALWINESLNKIVGHVNWSGIIEAHELRVCHVFRSGEVLYQVFIAAFSCSPAERLHTAGLHHDLQHRGCHVSNNSGSVLNRLKLHVWGINVMT